MVSSKGPYWGPLVYSFITYIVRLSAPSVGLCMTPNWRMRCHPEGLWLAWRVSSFQHHDVLLEWRPSASTWTSDEAVQVLEPQMKQSSVYILAVGWMDWELPYGEGLGESAVNIGYELAMCFCLENNQRAAPHLLCKKVESVGVQSGEEMASVTHVLFQHIKGVYQKGRNDYQGL